MTLTTLGGLPQFLRLLATDPTPDAAMAAVAAGPMSPFAAAAARFWLIDDADLVHAGSSGHVPDEIDRYRILMPGLPFRVWRAVRERAIVATTAEETREAALETVDGVHRASMPRRAAVETIVRAPLLQDGGVIGAIAVALRGPWPEDDDAAATLRGVAAALALWASEPNSRAHRAVAESRARAVHRPRLQRSRARHPPARRGPCHHTRHRARPAHLGVDRQGRAAGRDAGAVDQRPARGRGTSPGPRTAGLTRCRPTCSVRGRRYPCGARLIDSAARE